MAKPVIIKVKAGIKTLTFALALYDPQRRAVDSALHNLKRAGFIDDYNMEVKEYDIQRTIK